MRHAESTTADTALARPGLRDTYLRAQTAQALEAFEYGHVSHIALVGHSVRAEGDPHRVRQIVRNLISNALHYGGDAIRVEVSSDTTTAKVLVCDNGSPIPRRDRERIFEHCRRAHNVPGLAGSLGLGLAISRQLARRMERGPHLPARRRRSHLRTHAPQSGLILRENRPAFAFTEIVSCHR